MDAQLEYFACQAIGFSTTHTCDAEFNKLTSLLHPGLDSTSTFLAGLLPWLNLLFAIQVTDIKKAILKIVFYYSSYKSQDKTISISDASKQYS